MENGLKPPSVVIFIGPPGSGKDTQAARLVEESGFVQVPSSKIIQAKFAANPNDLVIQEELRKFETGKLNDSRLTSEWVLEFVRPLAARGMSLVFSGSLRTPEEAEIEFPALQELFGRENVLLIFLDINIDEMKRRIAGRRFCTLHGHVIPGTSDSALLKTCPQDGSKLVRRELDDESKLQTRHDEFVKLTFPVVELAKKHGVPVFTVDGSQSIESVHHEVAGIVELRKAPAPVE